MEWHDEVDIVCAGSGLGGLATAIAAVDAGFDIVVADAAGIEVEDNETCRRACLSAPAAPPGVSGRSG